MCVCNGVGWGVGSREVGNKQGFGHFHQPIDAHMYHRCCSLHLLTTQSESFGWCREMKQSPDQLLVNRTHSSCLPQPVSLLPSNPSPSPPSLSPGS